MSVRIAPLAICIVIPAFPNPQQFLQKKGGKKKRPFTNARHELLTAKSTHHRYTKILEKVQLKGSDGKSGRCLENKA